MDNRVVNYSFDDFVASPRSVAAALADTCNLKPLKYRVRGMALISSKVLFFLEKREGEENLEYIFDEPIVEDADEFINVVNGRWMGGYTTLGMIKVYGTDYSLFERSI